MASSKFPGRVRIEQFVSGCEGQTVLVEESERMIHRVTGPLAPMAGAVYFPIGSYEWHSISYRGERWPVFRRDDVVVWKLLLPDVRIMAERAEFVRQSRKARKKT